MISHKKFQKLIYSHLQFCSNQLHPIQIQRFREMSFAEKWAVAQGLGLMARDARLDATRRVRPDLSEVECQKIVAREFARART